MGIAPPTLVTALQHRHSFERELGCGGVTLEHLAHDLQGGSLAAVELLRPDLVPILGRTLQPRNRDHILPTSVSAHDGPHHGSGLEKKASGPVVPAGGVNGGNGSAFSSVEQKLVFEGGESVAHTRYYGSPRAWEKIMEWLSV